MEVCSWTTHSHTPHSQAQVYGMQQQMLKRDETWKLKHQAVKAELNANRLEKDSALKDADLVGLGLGYYRSCTVYVKF